MYQRSSLDNKEAVTSTAETKVSRASCFLFFIPLNRLTETITRFPFVFAQSSLIILDAVLKKSLLFHTVDDALPYLCLGRSRENSLAGRFLPKGRLPYTVASMYPGFFCSPALY